MVASPPETLGGKPRYCKICDTLSPVFGTLDFHDTNNPACILDKSGRAVTYNRCGECGALFSCSLDNWTARENTAFVYNDLFAQMDPNLLSGGRAKACADSVAFLFPQAKPLPVIDYGGGHGFFERELRERGFADVATYDPYFGSSQTLLDRDYAIVTSFEVIEHAINPLVTLKGLTELAGEDGVIFFATHLVPDDIEQIGLSWWYVNPRVGHMTLYSKKALDIAFGHSGFRVASFDGFWHLAFRRVPPFAAHLFPPGSTHGD